MILEAKFRNDPLWSLVTCMLFFLRILHKKPQNAVYENWKLEIDN